MFLMTVKMQKSAFIYTQRFLAFLLFFHYCKNAKFSDIFHRPVNLDRISRTRTKAPDPRRSPGQRLEADQQPLQRQRQVSQIQLGKSHQKLDYESLCCLWKL